MPHNNVHVHIEACIGTLGIEMVDLGLSVSDDEGTLRHYDASVPSCILTAECGSVNTLELLRARRTIDRIIDTDPVTWEQDLTDAGFVPVFIP